MSGFFEAIGLAKPAQPQPNQQQQQQQQQPGPNNGANTQNSGQGNNGVDPNAARQPNGNPVPNSNVNGSNTPPDPLAAYASIWDNTKQQQPEAAPSFSLDPKVIDQVTTNMDFTQGIPQELMQRVQQGDAAAMVEMMQHVGRQAYRNALTHTSSLTDRFVSMREDHFAKKVPHVIRDELTMGALGGENGSKMSPVARKQLADIAKRMQAANPDASPQEIATAAKQYVTDLYNAMNPDAAGSSNGAGGNSKQQASEPFDWDKWSESQ